MAELFGLPIYQILLIMILLLFVITGYRERFAIQEMVNEQTEKRRLQKEIDQE